MPLIDALLPEFDHEMTVTRKLLERVPEDRFDFMIPESLLTRGVVPRLIEANVIRNRAFRYESSALAAGSPS